MKLRRDTVSVVTGCLTINANVLRVFAYDAFLLRKYFIHAKQYKPALKGSAGGTIFRTGCEGKRVKRVKVALRRKKIGDIWPAREWRHLTTYLPTISKINEFESF